MSAKKIVFNSKFAKSVKTVILLHITAAKMIDFESSVKVKFLRDWPQFLDHIQAWSELQLIHFVQWSGFFKYLDQALKV